MTKSLGAMLIEDGFMTPAQVQQVHRHQQDQGGRFASTVMALGFADERRLATTLSRQLGIPCAIVSESAIELSTLSLVPFEIAKKHGVLPLKKDEQTLFVAMSDPNNRPVLDELCFVTGLRVVEIGALDTAIEQAIDKAYPMAQAGQEGFFQGAAFDTSLPLDAGGYMEVVSQRAKPSPAESQLGISLEEPILEMEELGIIEMAPANPASDETSRTILVVDDDEGIRGMVSRYFAKQGYSILEAEDGRKALGTLRTKLPDLIVLDAMLPGVHGFDICRQVKSSPLTKHIPVVMISAVYRGWGYENDVRQIYGADAFLEKPLSLRELKEVVTQAMAKPAAVEEEEDFSGVALAAIEAASQALHAGDLQGAVSQMRRAIEMAPFHALLHRKLSVLLEQLGDAYGAIDSMERAAQLEGTHAHLWRLAGLYEGLGFVQKAYETLEKCIRLDPVADDLKKVQERMQAMSQI